jgi:hypothetical protein
VTAAGLKSGRYCFCGARLEKISVRPIFFRPFWAVSRRVSHDEREQIGLARTFDHPPDYCLRRIPRRYYARCDRLRRFCGRCFLECGRSRHHWNSGRCCDSCAPCTEQVQSTIRRNLANPRKSLRLSDCSDYRFTGSCENAQARNWLLSNRATCTGRQPANDSRAG